MLSTQLSSSSSYAASSIISTKKSCHARSPTPWTSDSSAIKITGVATRSSLHTSAWLGRPVFGATAKHETCAPKLARSPCQNPCQRQCSHQFINRFRFTHKSWRGLHGGLQVTPGCFLAQVLKLFGQGLWCVVSGLGSRHLFLFHAGTCGSAAELLRSSNRPRFGDGALSFGESTVSSEGGAPVTSTALCGT